MIKFHPWQESEMNLSEEEIQDIISMFGKTREEVLSVGVLKLCSNDLDLSQIEDPDYLDTTEGVIVELVYSKLTNLATKCRIVFYPEAMLEKSEQEAYGYDKYDEVYGYETAFIDDVVGMQLEEAKRFVESLDLDSLEVEFVPETAFSEDEEDLDEDSEED